MHRPEVRRSVGLREAYEAITGHHPDHVHHAMVIDIKKTRDEFKHWKLVKTGYKGLAVYLLYCILFIFDLGMQKHEPAVGQANIGLQQTLEKSKADLVVTNSATMWTFMSTKVTKLFLNAAWNGEDHGLPTTGETSNEYFYVVGGLMMTTKKSSIKEDCLLKQTCYSSDLMVVPYMNLTIPVGGSSTKTLLQAAQGAGLQQPGADDEDPDAEVVDLQEVQGTVGGKARSKLKTPKPKAKNSLPEIQVPYRDDVEGYTVMLPSTATPGEIQMLLAAYAPLFQGQDTRQIRFDAIMFNPHGEETITSLSFEGSVSTKNDISFSVTVNSIPLYIYDKSYRATYIMIAIEIFNVFFVLKFLVAPFWDALTGEPYEEDPRKVPPEEQEALLERNMLARHQYLAGWDYLPIDSHGHVIFKTPLIQWSLFFFGIALWIRVLVGYAQLPDFSGKAYKDYFVSPFLGYETADIATKTKLALDLMQNVVMPFRSQVYALCDNLQFYFTMQTLTVLLMTVHFFEYLSFQRRLSMITDTFRAITDDLIHIGVVLLAVCFTIGTMSSLAFGAIDPSFQDFFGSFVEMIEQCFALFKPAAVTSYNPPLFKYVPHVLVGNSVMKWAPQAITLFFKLLVMLLLFKLLMGVIMEGYKSHSQFKNYPHTLRSDLKLCGEQTYQWLWRHRIRGDPYVSFEQIVISLALIRESGKFDSTHPWRTRYVGFSGGVYAVQAALNNVYTGDLPEGVDPAKRPKIKAVAKHYQFKNCEIREAQWVLEKYGIAKQVAMYELAEYVKKKEVKKEMERLNEEWKRTHPTREEETKRRAKARADDVLKDVEHKLTVAVHEHSRMMHSGSQHHTEAAEASTSALLDHNARLRLNLQFKLDDEVVKAVFEQFDIYGIGEINVKFMSQALGAEAGLGFEVPRDILNQLFEKYDENDNQSYDFEEFKQLVSDPLLQGRYVGSHTGKQKTTSFAVATAARHFAHKLKVPGVKGSKDRVKDKAQPISPNLGPKVNDRYADWKTQPLLDGHKRSPELQSGETMETKGGKGKASDKGNSIERRDFIRL